MSNCKLAFIRNAGAAMAAALPVLTLGPLLAHEGHDLGIVVKVPLLLAEPAKDGKEIYDRKCLSCHGNNMEGTHSGPSLIPYDRAHHPDGDFFRAIRNGVPEHHWNFGNMPPVEGLDDKEIENVIAYVRALQAYNSKDKNQDLNPN